jgi:hypothetical protein
MKRNHPMPIERLVVRLLPSSGCVGKVSLREPGEHTSSPNLAS